MLVKLNIKWPESMLALSLTLAITTQGQLLKTIYPLTQGTNSFKKNFKNYILWTFLKLMYS